MFFAPAQCQAPRHRRFLFAGKVARLLTAHPATAPHEKQRFDSGWSPAESLETARVHYTASVRLASTARRRRWLQGGGKLKALSPQLDVSMTRAPAAAPQVEREAVEAIRHDGRSRPFCAGDRLLIGKFCCEISRFHQRVIRTSPRQLANQRRACTAVDERA